LGQLVEFWISVLFFRLNSQKRVYGFGQRELAKRQTKKRSEKDQEKGSRMRPFLF